MQFEDAEKKMNKTQRSTFVILLHLHNHFEMFISTIRTIEFFYKLSKLFFFPIFHKLINNIKNILYSFQ